MRTSLFFLSLAVAMIPSTAQAQSFRGHNTKAPVDYAADRTEGSLRDDRALFSGNVVVRQADMTLNAARISVAFVDGKSRTSIKSIEASGGVNVRRGDESAEGRFAIYDIERRLITFIGDVALNQAGNIARGGRLVIDLDTGRAVLDGDRSGGGDSGHVTGTFIVPDRSN